MSRQQGWRFMARPPSTTLYFRCLEIPIYRPFDHGAIHDHPGAWPSLPTHMHTQTQTHTHTTPHHTLVDLTRTHAHNAKDAHFSFLHSPQNKRRHAGRPSPAQDHHQSRHSISSVCGYMTAGTDVRHKLKRLDPSSGPREPLARVLESLPLFIVSFATLFRCQRIPRIRCTGNAPLPML